ncbi:hypothetical protein B5G20_05125 [Collinsella sp. An7]|uniref:hypothetical protein n=1 Tax=Collinsella sp. An7 TaxID=1965651 RepID=UPI000B37F61A|nr:hypothetical protein [Collinsella sp. An7]OUN47350.1 hypothetical protein B5G20_05125 [Collinsella sp. An7]
MSLKGLFDWFKEHWLEAVGVVFGSWAAIHAGATKIEALFSTDPTTFMLLFCAVLLISFTLGWILNREVGNVQLRKIELERRLDMEEEDRRHERERRNAEEDRERAQRKKEKAAKARELKEREDRRKYLEGEVRHLDITQKAALYLIFTEGSMSYGAPTTSNWYPASIYDGHAAFMAMRSLGLVDYETTHDGSNRWTLTEEASQLFDENPDLLEEGRLYLEADDEPSNH